ncbi:MAG: AMP-binding protein, partial [Deltaproteobacteria bacterium]|nr:AMP-binding protein [Deltaproteobacteria bacterium]
MMQRNLDEYIAFAEEASNSTLGRVFDQTVTKYPDKEAFVFKNIRVTYQQAQDRVNKLAKGLLRLGVGKSDKVAVFMPNNLEWLYCYLAIAKIGATLVAVNTRFKSAELAHALIRSDVSTLILKDTFLGKINALKMVEDMCPELFGCEPENLNSEKLPFLKNVICLGKRRPKGVYSFDELMASGDDSALDDQLATAMALVTPDTALLHLLTSGTTGLPKAAEGTHRGWLRTWYWTFSASPRGLGLTEKDRILGVVPFSGGTGSGQMPTSILVGATLVIMESFDAEEALKTIEQERITGAT